MIQRIGLREILQESPMILMGKSLGFRLRFWNQPIESWDWFDQFDFFTFCFKRMRIDFDECCIMDFNGLNGLVEGKILTGNQLVFPMKDGGVRRKWFPETNPKNQELEKKQPFCDMIHWHSPSPRSYEWIVFHCHVLYWYESDCPGCWWMYRWKRSHHVENDLESVVTIQSMIYHSGKLT